MKERENKDEGAVTAANVAIFGGRGGRTAGGTSSCASEATFRPLPRRFARGMHEERKEGGGYAKHHQTRSRAGKYANHIPLAHAGTRTYSRNEACPIMCKFTSHRNALAAYRISLERLTVDSAAARHVARHTYLRKKSVVTRSPQS